MVVWPAEILLRKNNTVTRCSDQLCSNLWTSRFWYSICVTAAIVEQCLARTRHVQTLILNFVPSQWLIGLPCLRDGPLENLWGEGAGGIQKKYSRKGKLNEKKNSGTPINPKKYSCHGLKKIHRRNMITKKNSCGSKIPPPVTFLMVRP